ncbi:Hypothetical protein CINCED_3A001097 [Cinara cedri]|uniref:Uncharacterized protein n=1 Tax=Cinara cedri TaxID=506608 RepID=A0A5E4MGJ0_9HEMI|nr:Hypothetical protein CINCED_3A001097 [Cinara cedri]
MLLSVDDEIKKKTGVLMQCYDEFKSILQLTKEKYDQAETENNNVVIEYHNKLKELNDKCNENKILQETISELKSLTETNEKIEQEIESLNEVYEKNISEIHRFEEEKSNNSQISFSKPPLNLDLDDEFLGFDSVTVSQSLVKRRCVWEEIKLNLVRHLDELESDMMRMGNRVKRPVRFPNNTTYRCNYSKSHLKNKLSIQQLFNIWSKLIEWTQHG